MDGRLVVIAGASRCGKTAYLFEQIKPAKRIAAWDPEEQFSKLPGWVTVNNKEQLTKALITNGNKNLKVAFVAGGDIADAFQFFCRVVMFAARNIAPLDIVAEELADVTKVGKAPGYWGLLLRRGLKRGVNIYAISQRWAEADKTAIGNASEFVLFRSQPDDVRYLSKKTRVPESELDGLLPYQYVKYDSTSFAISRGITKKSAILARK